jgi:hypothetical protein
MIGSVQLRSRASCLTKVAVVVGCLLPRVVFSGEAIRVTCADGGGDLVEGNGYSILSAGLCDVDHTCDGFCTFAFDPDCPLIMVGDLLYSPGGFGVACPGLPAFPCPSALPHAELSPNGRDAISGAELWRHRATRS